jgi:putative ABC transport system substrate-binding protein
MEGKRLGFLTEMLPGVSLIAVLVNSTNLQTEASVKEIQSVAATVGRQLIILSANNERDIDAAFGTITEKRAGALLVGNDIFFNSRRDQLVQLAAHNKLPAIYEFREFVDAGGLMSYGTNLTDIYRQAGNYVGKILKGTKPAELPVMQSTKFELVINLKTATLHSRRRDRMRVADVRFRLLALSGHPRLHCTCPLLTQSGHRVRNP